MIINQANLNALFEGFNTRFNEAFGGAKSYVDSVAMTVPSSARQENYAWMGAMPGFREWLGPRVVQNLSLQSYILKNASFESTISVPRDDIDDDQYGVFGPMFSEMGRRAKTHPDELLFALIKNAFATQCYDGQNFFDTDHPVGDDANAPVTSVANTDSGSSAAWFLLDTSRAIRPFIWQLRKPYQLTRKDQPTDDNVFMTKEFIYGTDARCNVGLGLWQLAWGSKQTLDAAHYSAARKAMMAFKDDAGKLLGVVPDTLVCGPTNESAALKLLNSEYASGGESNEWKGTAKLIVTPYLD
ncbi:Mu-like prophage major head subunit gpT [Nitrobacter hamburgensis X14]|uniref:Mu-like prophage major head subunit gpT n=1 Tax=Nitrobacter hamburgensis (strain DSM 10229 / NCIMB 13809 / X14) TaxID=323097 RepID=Q1QMX1_NITHX|nr:Mu-like prophage major head subunit gpT family protein [Nitrobacter hamburgensis]ABE62426.1 Mu-like prophage major head subunit gpT [Nitrobacter hamburgensis X14]